MNKHIELVKKWLADPKSVTQKELDDNRNVENAAYPLGQCAYAAANAAYDAAYAAYATHTTPYTYAADYWVKRYEELTEQGE